MGSGVAIKIVCEPVKSFYKKTLQLIFFKLTVYTNDIFSKKISGKKGTHFLNRKKFKLKKGEY